MDCWAFKKCATVVRDSCPAHPENGKRCWKVTGTKCDSGRIEKATRLEKITFCNKCDFYRTYAERY